MREGYVTTDKKQPISNTNVLKLARAFGLKSPKIFAYNHGYRNHSFGILSEDKKYNLMLLKNEPNALERAERADAIAKTVAAHSNLPIRILANPRTLKVTTSRGFRLVRLYNWLPGDTIPWEAYTQKHLKALGITLSKLHKSISKSTASKVVKAAPTAEAVVLPDALVELLEQNTKMQTYFNNPAVIKALDTKLHLKTKHNHTQISRFLESHELSNLPKQPLHLDFVRGNILWEESIVSCEAVSSEALQGEVSGGDRGPLGPVVSLRKKAASQELTVLFPKISGIIDFEKTAMGSPLIDLARTYAFLLVDCPKPEDKIVKYFLHSGYIKYGRSQLPLPPKIFYNLTNYFLIFDLYKFLSHNPYESLVENYHFCCTRDILLSRNILEDL